MSQRVLLEPAAETVCQENSVPSLIFELPPKEGRMVLERAQDAPVFMYPAQAESSVVHTGNWGSIPVYWVTPIAGQMQSAKTPPAACQPSEDVIFYIHGAGWVFGSFHTHEKLVRELAARTGCTVIFPEYTRAPEGCYPAAIEQCYSVLCQLPQLFAQLGRRINGSTLTVAGDSAGGNMAIAMTLLSKYRRGPAIHKQLLFYPVTNACFDTQSYCEFAEDYYLYRAGMMWFWNQYTNLERCRNQITASPLRAGIDQLKGLPQAMIINGQADVLRDEGEAYAEKLRLAGVSVTAMRFQAIIHDFVMLNALDQTNACRAAMDVSTEWIVRKNREE